MPRFRSPIDRFNDLYSPEPTSGCWLWTGYCNRLGYGRFNMGRDTKPQPQTLAHRAALRLLTDTVVGDGQVVMHVCNTPACVNPDHLRVGTHKENAAQCWREKRGHRNRSVGENNKASKLSEQAVREIRTLVAEGKTRAAVAKQYGVAWHSVDVIHKNKTWRHIA